MKKEQLKELLSGDFGILVDVIKKTEKVIKLGKNTLSVADCMKQYDPFLHDVNDPAVREKRKLELEGEKYVDEVSGEEKSSIQYDEQEVNRLQLARQMQIVEAAVFFECGAEISLEYNEDDEAKKGLFELIQKVWKDNKLYFETEAIVERRMIETHCAELWYDYEDANYWKGTTLEGSTRRPGYLLLCKENGDDIYPVWDEHGDLIGLGRRYETTDPVTDIKTIHFDFYHADHIILGSQDDGGPWVTETKEGYGFLPIVYHEQKRPEWANIQPLANREETNLSNLADTNDYYGDPTMVVEGEAESLPSQGEVAKVIQVKGGDQGQRGSVSFAQPDAMVESKKLEFDRLKQEQFDITNTPDISFNTMSQLMSNGTSGIALRLLFMGPQMKGNKAQKRLKEMLTRRNNVIRKMLISFSPEDFKDMDDVIPAIKIKDALPVNKEELISHVTSMVNAKLLSRKTAMQMLGEVTDIEAEQRQILEEARQDQEFQNKPAEK